ncbi:MAG: Pycsar system effector family protein [Vicinamibacterales bacterium]
MLAFLHGERAATRWFAPWASWDWMSAVALTAMIGLSASVVLSAATVFPRTKGRKAGLLFWLAVAQRPTAHEYARDVVRATDSALVEATLTHTHELAKVCQGKYAALRWAFRAAAVGFGGAVVYLLFAAAA